ncbi:glutamate racemase [uncultured Mailhella sp.]|uniref:glutamate racemase n=1 Tax=uncultured Mailhella sp. TaxID=1981031 RepID=UPI00344D8157
MDAAQKGAPSSHSYLCEAAMLTTQGISSQLSAQRELPIGLFDSGVGGLTVLRAMREQLPNESFLFLGDTARVPYGSKSTETVQRYTLEATAKLVERGIKLLVIACNTATAAALPLLRNAYPEIDVVGVVEPGAEAACRTTRNRHIAVIATSGTIRSRAYEKAILRRLPDARLEALPCPLFVPMAEEGLVEGPLAEGIAARYLDELFRIPREQGRETPDTLVLACTHFPLLRDAIAHVAGEGVMLVDSAGNTAREVRDLLQKKHLARGSGPSAGIALCPGSARFLTTDDVPRFTRLGEQFLGIPIAPCTVELVGL